MRKRERENKVQGKEVSITQSRIGRVGGGGGGGLLEDMQATDTTVG